MKSNMADNVMGGGDEINLGLNVNLGLEKSIQDAASLADQISNMRRDQEAYNDAVSSTQEKLAGITQEYQTQVNLSKELLEAETQIRSISESIKSNSRDTVEHYRELSNIVNNLTLNMGRVNGGMGGEGMPQLGYGGGVSQGYGNGPGSGAPQSQQGTLYGPSGEPIRSNLPRYGQKDQAGGFPELSEAPFDSSMGGPIGDEGGFSGQGTRGGRNSEYGGGRGINDPIPSKTDRVLTPQEEASNLISGLTKNMPGYGGSATRSRQLAYLARNYPDFFANLSKGTPGSLTQKTVAGIGGLFNKFGGGNAASGEAFTSGELGATAKGLGKAGLYGYAAEKAYQMVATGMQQAQEFTGLTGGTSVGEAAGQDFGAFVESFGGLNPLISYAQDKQLRLSAAAQGYGLNSDMFNSAVGFGETALKKYNMQPDQSMAMFQQVVVSAGASVQELEASLATLAQTAKTTGGSFQNMQQQFMAGQTSAMSMGAGGLASTMIGTAAARQFAGNPMMNGASGPEVLLNSSMGQAMIANQLGVSYAGLGGYMNGMGGSGNSATNTANVIKASNTVIKNALASFGLSGNPTYNQIYQVVGNQFPLIQSVLAMYGVTDAVSSEPKMIAFIQSIFNGSFNSSGTTQADLQAQNAGVEKALGQEGATSIGQAVSSVMGSSANQQDALIQKAATTMGWDPNKIGIDYQGKFVSQSTFMHDNQKQREVLMSAMLSGDATLAQLGANGKLTASAGNSQNTLLQMLGGSKNGAALQAAFMGDGGMGRVSEIALRPEVAKYFQILGNPSQLINTLNQYQASVGQKPIA